MYAKSLSPFWVNTLAIIGALVVVVGAWNILSLTTAAVALGQIITLSANEVALGPALALDPTVLNQLSATSTAPLTPVRLAIPAIGVEATVEQVGLKADGSMATPSNFENVAWYSLGAKPGAPGNAVIDGHVNNALTKAGVFEHLSSLTLGDALIVTDSSGNKLSYVVVGTQAYAANAAPDGAIFATSGPSQLVLITCDGQWDTANHQFDKRLVVTARLVH